MKRVCSHSDMCSSFAFRTPISTLSFISTKIFGNQCQNHHSQSPGQVFLPELHGNKLGQLSAGKSSPRWLVCAASQTQTLCLNHLLDLQLATKKSSFCIAGSAVPLSDLSCRWKTQLAAKIVSVCFFFFFVFFLSYVYGRWGGVGFAFSRQWWSCRKFSSPWRTSFCLFSDKPPQRQNSFILFPKSHMPKEKAEEKKRTQTCADNIHPFTFQQFLPDLNW